MYLLATEIAVRRSLEVDNDKFVHFAGCCCWRPTSFTENNHSLCTML